MSRAGSKQQARKKAATKPQPKVQQKNTEDIKQKEVAEASSIDEVADLVESDHQQKKVVKKHPTKLKDHHFDGKIAIPTTHPYNGQMLMLKTRELLDEILCSTAHRYRRLVQEAGEATTKKTISEKFCITAVLFICKETPNLKKNVMTRIEKVRGILEKLGEVDEEIDDENKETKKKTMRRETKVDLSISVSKCSQILSSYIPYDRISSVSPYILSCLIETLMETLITNAGAVTNDDNKKKISPRHVFLSVVEDYEMKHFMESNGIVIAGCGSPKNLPTGIDKRKKQSVKTANGNTQYKNFPGTTALKEIKELQDKTGYIIADAPMGRMIKANFEGKSCSAESIIMIKAFTEYVIQKLFERAREDVETKKVETVTSEHIATAWKSIQYLYKIPYDNGKGYKKDLQLCIPDAQIKKLARRAGIIRVSSDMEIINRFILAICESICYDINALFITTEGKTVLARMVDRVFVKNGIYLCVNSEQQTKAKKPAGVTKEEKGQNEK